MDAPSVSQQEVTNLLARWSHGDDAALAELTPLIYEELRRIARAATAKKWARFCQRGLVWSARRR